MRALTCVRFALSSQPPAPTLLRLRKCCHFTSGSKAVGKIRGLSSLATRYRSAQQLPEVVRDRLRYWEARPGDRPWIPTCAGVSGFLLDTPYEQLPTPLESECA